jgi:alpha-tubulin suppressor-like RCC1 family protein
MRLALVSLIPLLACREGTLPSAATSRALSPSTARLSLSVGLGGAASSVRVIANYARAAAPSTLLPIDSATVTIAADSSSVAVPIDLATCLADPLREPPPGGSGVQGTCVLHLQVTTFGAGGEPLDGAMLDPIAARAGQQTKAPDVAFGLQRSLASGIRTSCALSAAGDAYCWGGSVNGSPVYRAMLGRGTDVTSSGTIPQIVAGGLKFRQISAGYETICGSTTSNEAYCWGGNFYGELAVATAPSSVCPTPASGCTSTPFKIPGLPAVKSVYAAVYMTCALATDGRVFCWGNFPNAQGALIRGTPQVVSGSVLFSSIHTSGVHVCGIATTGTAYCWGWDYGGEAGGVVGETFVPSPRPVTGIAVASISAGQEVTCALTAAGDAYCWGVNETGKLGTGVPLDSANLFSPQAPRRAPALVAGVKFRSIDAGLVLSACGVSISGQAYCWGENDLGQGGADPATSQNPRCQGGATKPPTGGCDLIPHPIASSTTFAEVSSGYDHTCGRTTGGLIQCWGNNSTGQLGPGTAAASSYVPVTVTLPH